MRGSENAKAMAKTLRQELKDRNIDIGHSDCLQIVAKQFGYRNWNTMAAVAGDREDADLKALPQGWEVISSNKSLFRIGVEKGAGLEGRSAIRIQGQGTEFLGSLLGWTSIRQLFSAEDYRGRNIRFSASLRCEELVDVAFPWLRVDNTLGQKLNYIGRWEIAEKDVLSETTDWRRLMLVVAVPEHAHTIEFGVTLNSTVGSVWVADMDFGETTEAVTPIRPVVTKAPQNLVLTAA